VNAALSASVPPPPSPVKASDKAEVMEVAHRWADSFGRRSFDADNAPCADDAVVIDDLPPHVWRGPGACSKWFKAFAAWAAKAAAKDAVLRLGETRHFELDGRFAYLVAPITLSYSKAGKPVDFAGTLALALRKADSGWQVSGAAWADQ
jgi:ketosteroid isomerase-like protein